MRINVGYAVITTDPTPFIISDLHLQIAKHTTSEMPVCLIFTVLSWDPESKVPRLVPPYRGPCPPELAGKKVLVTLPERQIRK